MGKRGWLFLFFILFVVFVVIGFLSVKGAKELPFAPKGSVSLKILLSSLPSSSMTSPVWLNNNEIVSEEAGKIFFLDAVSGQKSTPLPSFSNPVTFITAANNTLLVVSGASFNNTKQVFVYKGGLLKEIDLAQYGNTSSFSLSPDGQYLFFVGLYNPSLNTGNLYEVSLGKEGEFQKISSNVTLGVFNWFDEQKAFVCTSSDQENSSQIYTLTLSPFSVQPLQVAGQSVTSARVSPDKQLLALDTDGGFYFTDLAFSSPPRIISATPAVFCWLKNNLLLLLSKTKPGSFTVFSPTDNKESSVVTPLELFQKTSVSLISSPLGDKVLIGTEDGAWYVVELVK